MRVPSGNILIFVRKTFLNILNTQMHLESYAFKN
jgi:hypothetical protein